MTLYDVNQLVESAVESLQTGDRATARSLLVQALRLDPRHEMATLWLSGTSEHPAEQRRILQRVLEINPLNSIAQRGLVVLEQTCVAEPAPHDELVSSGKAEPEWAPVSTGAQDELVSSGKVEPGEAEPEWAPPEPLTADQLVLMPAECAQCRALVYGNTSFCWRCHAPVHCCQTCMFVAEARCKELQGINEPDALNTCAWWRPLV